MLKNNKGYLLVECMMGLLLFSVAVSVCFPLVNKLYQENQTTKQLLYAINEADSAIATYSLNHTVIADRRWNYLNTSYSLQTNNTAEEGYEICIVFQGANKKEYKKCAAAL
jgi:hypothetical protein